MTISGMADVLISIRKVHCDAIFLPVSDPGRKIIEVRLKALPIPSRCWVVETGRGGCRKVIGRFTSLTRITLAPEHLDDFLGGQFCAAARLTRSELAAYMNGRTVYGGNIVSPVRFGRPIALDDLDTEKPVKRPPQSWQYITLNTTPA